MSMKKLLESLLEKFEREELSDILCEYPDDYSRGKVSAVRDALEVEEALIKEVKGLLEESKKSDDLIEIGDKEYFEGRVDALQEVLKHLEGETEEVVISVKVEFNSGRVTVFDHTNK